MIRVILPAHLRTLARVEGEVKLEVDGPVTQGAVLDALEAAYPMLRGTIRDQVTRKRRAFLRFFACEQDFSNDAPDAPLPEAVATGAEPLLIVGAMAGGSDLEETTIAAPPTKVFAQVNDFHNWDEGPAASLEGRNNFIARAIGDFEKGWRR
jgi:sulfur-carrier protein